MPNPANDGKKQPMHPRVVPYGTVRIKNLVDQVEKRSGLSSGDVKGVLQTLADVIADKLEDGYIVELEGFGFFSLSLESRPVMEKRELRSESVHFRNVNFRCGKYLKNKLKTMRLERMPEPKGTLPPFGERVHRLTRYFETHSFITCGDYRNLTGCSKYRALQDLNKLIDEGKLEKHGYKSTRVYSLPSSVNKGLSAEG